MDEHKKPGAAWLALIAWLILASAVLLAFYLSGAFHPDNAGTHYILDPKDAE